MERLIEEYKKRLTVIDSELRKLVNEPDVVYHKKLSIKHDCYREFIVTMEKRVRLAGNRNERARKSVMRLLEVVAEKNPVMFTSSDKKLYKAWTNCKLLY